MFYYTPKLHHAMIVAAIWLLLIAGGAYTDKERILKALNTGAWVFGFMWLVIMALLVLKAYDDHIETQTDFARVYGGLDEEARAALGFQFPTMTYRMKRGEVRGYFENTSATIEHFRVFLQTSNQRSISPRRDWQTAEKPEWAWEEIKGWLDDQNYIVADSAAGSHSWLWSGQSYKHLMAYWMAGRELKNANEVTYAYEEQS